MLHPKFMVLKKLPQKVYFFRGGYIECSFPDGGGEGKEE